jgi:predicted aspartyl protease
MPTRIGFLDSAGQPKIRIKVYGLSEQFAREFDAMIDTGFSGFLMMPLTDALPLALTLYGTSSYTLADGTTSPKLLAFGRVKLEDEEMSGVIVLEGNPRSGPLLEMDFIRRYHKMLLVYKSGVVLFDEKEIQDLLEKMKRENASPESRSPKKPGATVGNPPDDSSFKDQSS